MTSHSVHIGLVQLGTEPFEVRKNRLATVERSEELLGAGADIVVLPEMVIPGYIADARALKNIAEPVDGPTVSDWHRVARTHDGYIAGGFCEREGDALYNSAVLVGPRGILLHYRKLHLFSEEKMAFRPGDLGLPVGHTRFGTVGLCVCYDLRFVEVARILALRGADLICVPTAWLPGFDDEEAGGGVVEPVSETRRAGFPHLRGEESQKGNPVGEGKQQNERGMCSQAHGAVLQANLNQTFIACASQAGIHGGLEFLGSSIVADPYGKIVAGPMSGTDDGTVVVEVDISVAKRAQVRAPLIQPRADRRRDVYGLWTEEGIL